MRNYAEELSNYIAEFLDNSYDDGANVFYSAKPAPDGVEVKVYSTSDGVTVLKTLKVSVTNG